MRRYSWPNGCGKTTLFSMCIGELTLDSGKIFLKNKPIHEIPIHLRAKEGLGYLPQQRSVFDMSVLIILWELRRYL